MKIQRYIEIDNTFLKTKFQISFSNWIQLRKIGRKCNTLYSCPLDTISH